MTLTETLLENAAYEREFCLAKLKQLQDRIAELDEVIPQYRDRILREDMGVTLRGVRDGRYEVER